MVVAFIWAQWPSRDESTLPQDPYLLHSEPLGFEVQFEQLPKSLGGENEAETQGFVTERLGLSQMVQVLNREGQSDDYWISLARRNDQQNFSGDMVLDRVFTKAGYEVHEYALKNKIGFVNQVRMLVTEDRVYKWSVAYKDREDPELQTRILTFLDSFEVLPPEPEPSAN